MATLATLRPIDNPPAKTITCRVHTRGNQSDICVVDHPACGRVEFSFLVLPDIGDRIRTADGQTWLRPPELGRETYLDFTRDELDAIQVEYARQRQTIPAAKALPDVLPPPSPDRIRVRHRFAGYGTHGGCYVKRPDDDGDGGPQKRIPRCFLACVPRDGWAYFDLPPWQFDQCENWMNHGDGGPRTAA